jgi:hypothetical protein
MKKFIFLSIFSYFTAFGCSAQKKKFLREVTIKDSITLSLINQYIEKVPEKKVLTMTITVVKDTVFYRFAAIATSDVILEIVKPLFVLQHKDYYVLINSGLVGLLEGDEDFAHYLIKKFKKHLEPGSTAKDLKDGSQEINLGLIYDPPIMFATYSRGGVQIRWNGL